MKKAAIYLGYIALVLSLILLMTYGLAAIGEPQSQWLWCDIIGKCPGGGAS